MVASIVITGCILLVSFWNLLIAILGLFPRCRGETVGTLTKASTQRNVRPSRHSWKVPIFTEYVYMYSVKGRDYHYSGSGSHSKKRLLPKVPLVFVKGFPRHAYPNKFKGTKEWIVGVFALLIGVVLMIVIILTY